MSTETMKKLIQKRMDELNKKMSVQSLYENAAAGEAQQYNTLLAQEFYIREQGDAYTRRK